MAPVREEPYECRGHRFIAPHFRRSVTVEGGGYGLGTSEKIARFGFDTRQVKPHTGSTQRLVIGRCAGLFLPRRFCGREPLDNEIRKTVFDQPADLLSGVHDIL